MCSGTKPGNRILGVHSELLTHDISPPRRENGEDQEGVSSPLEQAIRQGFSPLDWPANVHHTSPSPCPTPLQGPTEAQEHSTLLFSLLRHGDRTGRSCEERPPLLDQSNAPLERETHHDPHCRGHHNIRCFNIRLGCELWNFSDRGTVDTFGISNAHQLRAAYLAPQTYAARLRNQHILLLIDNRTALAYLNHKGGTWSKQLSDLALEVADWCLRKNLTIHAEHIPGRLNTTADMESRRKMDSSDWRLSPEIFCVLMQRLGPCNIDLLAARHNTQLERFFSFRPDPQAEATCSEMGSTDSLCLSSFHSGRQGLAEDEAGVHTAGSGD